MARQIPKPVLLNCWKHHLGFIIGQINSYKLSGLPEQLKNDLLNIGNSTTDLYTGNISPAGAATIAIDLLKKKKLYPESIYETWIHDSEENYRTLVFPDRSAWIFKIGNDHARYIHIHPGRYVPQTMRVKASVLKTVISSLIEARLHGLDPLGLDTVNHVRKIYLDQTPVKNIRKHSELDVMLNLVYPKIIL